MEYFGCLCLFLFGVLGVSYECFVSLRVREHAFDRVSDSRDAF